MSYAYNIELKLEDIQDSMVGRMIKTVEKYIEPLKSKVLEVQPGLESIRASMGEYIIIGKIAASWDLSKEQAEEEGIDLSVPPDSTPEKFKEWLLYRNEKNTHWLIKYHTCPELEDIWKTINHIANRYNIYVDVIFKEENK